jgi:hypothetical protein
VSAAKILKKLEATHRTWGMRLDGLGDEAFLRPARGGGWGIGQICRHIELVSGMLLDNGEMCARGDGRDLGFQLQPAMIMLFGTLPPVRIKVPELPDDLKHLGQPEPIDAADSRDALESVAQRMRDLRDTVAASSPRCRREHPAGGWLNALQWYALTEMHYRHHLRQLARLRAITGS